MGVLGFANFVQTFYYSGNLPLTNMPEVGLVTPARWTGAQLPTCVGYL